MISNPFEQALLKREKGYFILRLNKGFYDRTVVQRALEEDSDWIAEEEETSRYFCVRCKTSDMEDVLNWINYLIYLSKEDI